MLPHGGSVNGLGEAKYVLVLIFLYSMMSYRVSSYVDMKSAKHGVTVLVTLVTQTRG